MGLREEAKDGLRNEKQAESGLSAKREKPAEDGGRGGFFYEDFEGKAGVGGLVHIAYGGLLRSTFAARANWVVTLTRGRIAERGEAVKGKMVQLRRETGL